MREATIVTMGMGLAGPTDLDGAHVEEKLVHLYMETQLGLLGKAKGALSLLGMGCQGAGRNGSNEPGYFLGSAIL